MMRQGRRVARLLDVALLTVAGARLAGAEAAPFARPAPPALPVIRDLGQLGRLSPEQAAKRPPVHLTATATYYHHEWEMLYLQDAAGAAFVYVDSRRPKAAIRPGTLVEVIGKAVPGDFAPSISEAELRPIRQAAPPEPQIVGLKQIVTGAEDARWIEISGIVRSAAIVDDLLQVSLALEGGKMTIHIRDWRDKSDFREWLVDSVVRVRGVCTTVTNEHRQFLGAELWSPDWTFLTIDNPSPADPWAAGRVPLDELRRLAFAGGHERRIKVEGTVTLQQPRRGVFLQDENDGIFVQTSDSLRLDPGDHVFALGFLAPGADRPTLEDGHVRRLGGGDDPPPVAVTPEQALAGKQDSRLVKVSARVVGRIVSGVEPTLVLQEGSVVFNARLQQEPEMLADLEPGGRVALVGVCSTPAVEAGAAKAFQVLLRSAADVTILEHPSWWTAERVRGLLIAVSGVFVAALGWAAMLRRRVLQQTRIIRTRLENEAALERRYRELVENANDLVFSLDTAGRFTSVNASAMRILGYTREEIVGRVLEEIAAPPYQALAREACAPAAEDTRRHVLEVIGRDDRRVVLEVSARARRQEDGSFAVDGIARDITERRRAEEELRSKEEALRESQQRFALAVRGTNDGLWDWDLRAGRVYFSPRWKSMLGYLEDEIGDSPADWFRLVHPDDLGRLTSKLTDHQDGLTPHFEHEHRMLHKDGGYRWVLNRGFALRHEDGTAYRMAGAQTDVNDRRSYDALTGLPNKALFVERLEKLVMRVQRSPDHLFAVLFLDLDRFKLINDSLGHLTGDRLLVAFARRLEECIRPADMIARFGGDEFAILVDAIEAPAAAARVAERIQQALARPFDLGGPEVYTSGSIGIALSSTGYHHAEDLLRDADTAMYRAKAGGRARYEVFDAAMRRQVTVFMRTQNDLRRALERDELRLHYQPIVELAGGAVTAFEALVRWQHPERGLLTPSEFIEIADDTGLIVPIGDWVLRRACRQLRSWRERFAGGPALAVSVNFSARQISDPDLVARVGQALAESQLAPEGLVLEITENALIESADAAMARIAKIRELGVRLHLDDFGTGYSSLSYLHRFPIEAIKIDRSFVSTMMHNEDARSIVRSVLSLAESLRLSTIAEGVETTEQAELLASLGCGQGQGFYFSAALEPAMATALLASAPGGALVLGRKSRSGVA